MASTSASLLVSNSRGVSSTRHRRATCGGSGEEGSAFGAHQGMDDGLQALHRRFIADDVATERRTIDRPLEQNIGEGGGNRRGGGAAI